MSMLLDRQVKGLAMFLCLSFLAFVLAQVMLAGLQVSAAEDCGSSTMRPSHPPS